MPEKTPRERLEAVEASVAKLEAEVASLKQSSTKLTSSSETNLGFKSRQELERYIENRIKMLK